MKKGVPGVSGYQGPAGGWGAVKAVTASLFSQKAVARDIIAMFKMNQVKGFDCPGCAWPDPGHRAPMELCENGVKAVSWETTNKKASPEFFSRHPVSTLWHYSDYELENIGRLTHPMKYDAASDTWQAVDWDIAFQEIGERLRSYDSAQQVEFYTSGRTSNEAAFLYQLFAREYGTNNFPDCSNMCHESTSVGLAESIGIGKASVSIEDVYNAQLIIVAGQNPGTNHPRMLSALEIAKRNGATVTVAVDYKGTISGGPDFAYQLCAARVSDTALARLDLSGWRVAYSGSEPIRLDTLERFAEKFAVCGFSADNFFASYGLAEATLFVAGGKRGHQGDGADRGQPCTAHQRCAIHQPEQGVALPTRLQPQRTDHHCDGSSDLRGGQRPPRLRGQPQICRLHRKLALHEILARQSGDQG